MNPLGLCLVLASPVLYLIALSLPAIRVKPIRYSIGQATSEPRFTISTGWQCLTAEYLVVPAWLANPLLAAGWIALTAGEATSGYVLGCIAIGSAVIAGILALGFGRGLAGLRPGYYVWLASIVSFTIGARHL